jgi:valine dehydrogenase (NAD+)
MLDVFPDEHEQVVFCTDRQVGLRAVIAIYSTALGPALGGTRFHAYPRDQQAVTDALDLSRAMAYKAALAGLDLGGGKAVILGDPASDKTTPLLRAYGRYVDSLGGRYITACDVGTQSQDMEVIARETRFVTGRPQATFGGGDSAVPTAAGVYQGMLAAAEAVWGEPSLAGRRVGVAGVGKVGWHLAQLLVAGAARVVVCDVDPAAVARARALEVGVEALAVDALAAADLDVLAPCALGGALNEQTVERLQAAVVCGGANNQLARPELAKTLQDRGILYVPDYVVNAGGLIHVADEYEGYSEPRVRERVAGIFQTTRRLLAAAAAAGEPPAVVADRMAEERMAAGPRGAGPSQPEPAAPGPGTPAPATEPS